MNFLKDDEFILLMNYNPTILYDCGTYFPNLSERIRFRDVGIQTAIEYPQWYAIEPVQGEYDFVSIENMLFLNRSAGMKTIFSIPGWEYPKWMTDEWFGQDIHCVVNRRFLSLWNKDAQEYQNSWMDMLIKKYQADDVFFVLGEFQLGEGAMPHYPTFYDRSALKDYHRVFGYDRYPKLENEETQRWLKSKVVYHMLQQQRLFYPQRKELWNMQQWLMSKLNPATMNHLQPDILDAYKVFFPDANLVLLQYTFYDHDHPQENVEWVDTLKKQFNMDVIVEAHFCEGLKVTAPDAIAKGFRGQIICPTHSQTGHRMIEDWMYGEIKKYNELWRTKYEKENII